jgi:hypothetical protein
LTDINAPNRISLRHANGPLFSLPCPAARVPGNHEWVCQKRPGGTIKAPYNLATRRSRCQTDSAQREGILEPLVMRWFVDVFAYRGEW